MAKNKYEEMAFILADLGVTEAVLTTDEKSAVEMHEMLMELVVGEVTTVRTPDPKSAHGGEFVRYNSLQGIKIRVNVPHPDDN